MDKPMMTPEEIEAIDLSHANNEFSVFGHRLFQAWPRIRNMALAAIADREDAERYRWMKANNGDWYAWSMRKHGSKNLDAAIDEARRAGG